MWDFVYEGGNGVGMRQSSVLWCMVHVSLVPDPFPKNGFFRKGSGKETRCMYVEIASFLPLVLIARLLCGKWLAPMKKEAFT